MTTHDGWQPIETAPRDRRVLLCKGAAIHIGVRSGSGWIAEAEPVEAHVSLPTQNWQPTHWQPLPAPPEPRP